MKNFYNIILMLMLLFGKAKGQCSWTFYSASSCSSGCTGTITVDITGWTPPFVYSLDGMPPTNTNIPIIIMNGICPGTHYFTVTDAAACTHDTIFTTLADSIIFQNVFLQKICDGDCITIIPSISGSCAPFGSFIWSTGANTQNITVCTPGNYTLTITDACGCVGTHTYTIGSSPCCIPFDTTNYPVVCERSTYTYTAPFHPGSLYQWNIAGDSIYTVNNNSVTVTWQSIQSAYQYGGISYIETFANGNQQSNSQTYIITASPNIGLVVSPADVNHEINICKGQSVSFINQTTDADYFHWDFGDGYTSAAQDVSHAYYNAGTYITRFEASTNCGCSAVDSFTVNVSNAPGADIVCRSIVCQGDTAVYTTSAVCNNYYWSVSAGIIISPQPYSNNIQVVWNNATGNGTVSLSVGNCFGACTDTTVLNIPVLTNGSVITGRDTVCQNQSYTYSVPFIPGTIYYWNLSPASAGSVSGNGTNEITVAFNSNPSCTLSVNCQNSFLGCSGNGTKNILVAPQIQTGTSGAQFVCKNDSILVSASLPGYAGQFIYTIINPLGNVTVLSNTGWYYLTCADTGYYAVSIVPAAAALFCELPDTLKKHCVTTEPLDSISGANYICSGNTYTYTAYGALPDHYLIWGATGGTVISASGENKTTCNITWNGAAPHIAYCVQHDENGNNCRSDTVFYNVNEVTSATINGPSNVCINGIYTYDVIVADMPDAYYEWTVTSNLASVKSGQGTKQVEVEFHNAVGNATVQCTLKHCSAIMAIMNNIIVSPAAAAGITPAVPVFCEGGTLNIQSDPATAYVWRDSINAVVGTSPSITVSSGGNYSLVVTDANQCRSTLSFYVTENPAPEAILTSPSANVYCIPTPVNATLYAVTNPGYSYQWINNGMNIPGATSPVLNTTQTGNYEVLVTNNFGCSKISNGFLIITDSCNGNPSCSTSEIISANVTNNNCNPIGFSGFYSAGVTNPVWNFGDPASGTNNTSPLNNPTHLYTKPGYYYATYAGIVTNLTPPPPQCLLIDLVLATVLGICDFDVEPACAGLPTQFINQSLTLPPITVSSYHWDFGDNDSSLLQNPQHSYQYAGTYTVTLTISYSTCTSVTSRDVIIPGASVSFVANPSPTCIGTPVAFTLSNNGASPLIDWKWDFGDGISSLNLSPVRVYAASGNFSPTLIVTDSKGCSDTVSQNIFVNPAPVPGIITPAGPVNECSYTPVLLTAPLGVSYLWSDGSLAQTFAPVTTGNYFVEVTDVNQCIYTTPPVEINISTAPAALIRGNNEICQGSSSFLNASTGASLAYEWHLSPSNQIVSTGNYYNFPYTNSPGSYFIYLVETDNINNCVDTSDIFTITVHPNPPVPILMSIPQGFLCAGNNSILEVMNPLTNGIYLWSNGQVIIYNNMNNPQINVTSPGDYSVIVTDSNGCRAYSNFIAVQPPDDFTGMIPGCYELCDTITHTLIGAPCMNGTGQWIDISQQPAVVVSTNFSFNVSQSGIYQYVCNSQNCSDTSEAIDITIIHCCPVEPPHAQITFSNDTIFSSITNSSFTFTWLLNNQIIPGAIQPMLTSITDGCYTLLVSDTAGCSTTSNTLCFVFTNVVEINQSNELLVFPNPASDILQFKTFSDQQTHLKIVDIKGRIVFENVFTNSVSVNIESFAKGLYVYSASFGKTKMNSGKIVIE